ncbi:MAG: amino acid adenylation domain-containing protein, partial [Verrucomicrobia bacterium]|nr:amino acid adenylation domain-containing protein [Verrucomicrobiota bacterium]
MESSSADRRALAKEAAYPLSPLQQGMLFQHLVAPGSGVDIEQMVCTLPEAIALGALRDAWQRVVDRHAILRTGFRWEGLESPQQEVWKNVTVPFDFEDWSRLSDDQQKYRLVEFLRTDRLRGFAINEAPLMRVILFRTAPQCYEMVWTFHHALLDGRSFPLVLREVFSIYEAMVGRNPIELPPPRPYRDYIDWLATREAAGSEQFWREILRGFSAPTPLVVERISSASAKAELRQGDRELYLSPQTTAALETFARENEFTMNTLLQGAWALLLSRYSGEEDVVFGATRACRKSTIAGAESMVGLFINTLPVRVKVPSEAALLPWLRELRAQWIAVRPHEHTPLAQVQSWSDLPSGRSLFESILVFENYQLDTTLRAQGGAWSQRQFRLYEQNGFPITVAVYAGPQLGLKIEFDRTRFDDATIDRMLGHIQTLLEGIAADPQARLGALPLLTASEERELLIEWNRPSLDTPSASPEALAAQGTAQLHALFEAQAVRVPDAIALVCEEQQLTYRELNARSNQVAHYLRGCGVGPDVIVGLCLDRSLELVIGLLGILKAGGAYLPIDLSYPSDRLAFMLADAQAPVLLTQTKLLSSLPASKAKNLCLDGDALPLLNSQPTDNPAPCGTPDNLAYVIFTSGSTGKPKGALITHCNVTRLFCATDPWFSFNERDVWTLFHSYAFDFSVWEIWGALLYGGRLVVVPFQVSRSPEAFCELLARERVTVLNQTPSAFRQLIQAEEAKPLPEPLALRLVIFGGEALELQSLKPWFDRHGDQRPQLVNMYGITETTVHVTYRPLTKNDLTGGSVIGVPIPDLQIYILDQFLRPVPIGVPGEMFVGGAGLARGYLNRPQLTDERFIANPFGNQNGSKLYRTGDLARWLPTRDIEYLGRIDHQVKIRGFRIELGEIESVLGSHPAVRAVVVLVREDAPGDKRLTAYLVADHPTPAVSDLRTHAKQKLPDYMVPAAFVFLDKLPLTTNGKIDRKALPAPEQNRPELGAGYVAPQTEAEKVLAAIWAKVLRVERVGVLDNYFELGGDSILSIQIVSQARAAGWPLTPKMLFDHQTVAELAAAVPKTTSIATEQGGVSGEAVLTPIQHWFFEQELSGLDHYNQSFLFNVSTPLDAALFAQAVSAVENHHDVLRLRFSRTDAGWRQEFSGVAEASAFQVIDLSDTPAPQQLAAIEIAAAELQASLDISSGPLWRVAWFDLGASRPGRLLIVIHHLAVDGVSWRNLLEDLETTYAQLRESKHVRLPPKTTSFQRWAEKLVEFAASKPLAAEREYWREVPAKNLIPLPVDATARGENSEASVKTITVTLDADATRALLQEVPAVYNTQINDVLLAALSESLSDWLGAGSLLIDLEGHGREEIADDLDLSRTVGWFTSIFPVRLELAPTPGTRARLLAVKEQLRRIPRRGIGYGVLRYLNGDTELAAQPQASVVFNYLGQFDQVLAGSALFSFAREATGPWHSPQACRRHLLEINSLIVGGRLELRWNFSENLHRRETIQRVAENFLAALQAIIEHCQSPHAGGCSPSDFPLAKLDQAALDRITPNARNVEDIYPLAPIQQLYLTLDLVQRDIGFDQWHFELRGQLDVAALQKAWEQVFNRHTILRSAFVAQGVAEPVQIVHRRVKPDWNELDWRGLGETAQTEKFKEFLRSDRERGFNSATAPLTRITLIRLADERTRCVWSHHHLQIDGWSWPLVFQEVSAFYEAAREKQAPSLPPPRPYREYVAWLTRQDSRAAEKFWRETLRGFTEPTPLPATMSDSSGAAGTVGEKHFTIPAEFVGELQSLARTQHVTLGTLVQAAWALLLARASGRSDVVFGGTFSGRPAELPGVDSIVGPFVNNLPVRVAVAEDDNVADFLERIHARSQELGQHQFAPLVTIQKWSEVPARHRLFNSLLVFQNYSVSDAASRLGRDVEIRNFTAPVRTNYPLTFVATPGAGLELNLIYQGDHA